MNSTRGQEFPIADDVLARVHAHPECAWPTNRREWDLLADCTACGLTLLRLYVNSATWVVRRVENIEFLDDRTVRRRVSVDFLSPPDAVVFSRADGTRQRVLPLTMMRRKSLVNFDLRDERGDALPLLGLRENQAPPWRLRERGPTVRSSA